jgi:hypothetical protein
MPSNRSDGREKKDQGDQRVLTKQSTTIQKQENETTEKRNDFSTESFVRKKVNSARGQSGFSCILEV